MRIRKYEQAQQQRRADSQVHLERARKRQFAEKDERLQAEAKSERENFMKIIQRQREAEDEERRQNERRVEVLQRHKHTLTQQMERNAQQRQNEKEWHMNESKRVEQALEEQRENIRQIKIAKLASVAEIEVHNRYKADLINKKVSF